MDYLSFFPLLPCSAAVLPLLERCPPSPWTPSSLSLNTVLPSQGSPRAHILVACFRVCAWEKTWNAHLSESGLFLLARRTTTYLRTSWFHYSLWLYDEPPPICKRCDFTPLYGCMKLRCACTPRFIYLFICWWTLSLVPRSGEAGSPDSSSFSIRGFCFVCSLGTKRKRLSQFTDGLIIKKWFLAIFGSSNRCKNEARRIACAACKSQSTYPFPIPGSCCTQCGLGLLRLLIQAMSSMSKCWVLCL